MPRPKILFGVIDDLVRSERAHELDNSRAADAGDRGAKVLGDLHRSAADAARGAYDEHLIAALDAALTHQEPQCGVANPDQEPL